MLGVRRVCRGGVGRDGYSFNWPQWVTGLFFFLANCVTWLYDTIFLAQTWTIRQWMPDNSLCFMRWNKLSINLYWTKHFPGKAFELSPCKQSLFLRYLHVWPHLEFNFRLTTLVTNISWDNTKRFHQQPWETALRQMHLNFVLRLHCHQSLGSPK